MKKLIALLCLIGLDASAAAPAFLGSINDYITNTSGTVTFVFSNRVRVVYSRGIPTIRYTNDVVGQTLTMDYGTVDTNGTTTFSWSFGNLGGLWLQSLTTNQFSLYADSGGTLIGHYRRNDGLWTFVPMTAVGYAETITVVSGVGGANTNFTMQANTSLVHIDAGTTNVHIVGIMYNDFSGPITPVEWEGAVVFTNRTATARTISFSSVTNNWICLQNFDGIADATNGAAIVCTNSQAVYLWRRVKGSNVVYAFKHASLPAN